MRKFILLFVFALPACGQSIYVYPQTVIVPPGTTQTVTAVITGTNDKTVTWSTTGGTITGANPCAVNEPCTIGLKVPTASTTYTLTATSNANGAVHAASTITTTVTPVAASNWPRLGVTNAQIPGLQAKAVAGNTNYTVQQSAAIAAYTADNAIWSWSCNGGNGQPSSAQYGKESDARLFAIMQLINPYPTAQATYNWGCYGRDIWTYEMGQQLSGAYNIIGNTWSDTSLNLALTTDELRGSGSLSSADLQMARVYFNWLEQTTLNYFYGITPPTSPLNSPTLAGNAIANMRSMGNNYTESKLLLTTAAALTFNDTTGDDPTLAQNGALMATVASGGSGCAIGNTNSIAGGTGGVLQVVATSGGAATGVAIIAQGGSYSLSTQSTTAVTGSCTGLTVTLTKLSNTCGAARGGICSDYSVGDLHGYWTFLYGSFLYLDWAHLEDPNVVRQAYNAAYGSMPTIPTCAYTDGSTYSCFGDNRDGSTSEGTWYQYSLYKLAYVMNMIRTAGYNDPVLYGPQMSVITSSWWDMKYLGDASLFTDMSASNGPGPGISPAFSYLTTGDSNTYARTVADMWTEAAMLTGDSFVGRTDRSNALKWLFMNVAYGGTTGTVGGCNQYCGFDYNLNNNVQNGSYIAFDTMISLPAGDPQSTPPSDPRPSFPTDFFDGSFNQHLYVRSGWTPNNYTLFTSYCNNGLIDHEKVNCDRFDIFSNGEYITKGRTEFDDYNDSMSIPSMANGASYLNITGTGCGLNNSCFVQAATAYGGEYWHGQQQALAPGVLHSELPTYAAISETTTLLYNGWFVFSIPFDVPSYNDITAASRDLFYLRTANSLFFYDRSITGHSAEKYVSVNTTGAPTIAGNTATWATRSGNQKAHLTSLLTTGTTFFNAHLPNTTTTTVQFANIQQGTTATSSCTANFVDGSSQNITAVGLPGVYYFSSNTSVATINPSTGVITGVGVGSATISCYYYAGTTGSMVSAVTINVVSGASSGSASNTSAVTQASDWEPYSRMQTDINSAATSNLEHFLCWDPTASPVCPTPTLVQSSSGQGFDGISAGTSQVMFMHTPATFTGTVIPVSGAGTLYVNDLAPNTSYSSSGPGVGASVTTDNAGVAVLTPTGAGSVVLGSGGPPPTAPTNLQGVILQGVQVQ